MFFCDNVSSKYSADCHVKNDKIEHEDTSAITTDCGEEEKKVETGKRKVEEEEEETEEVKDESTKHADVYVQVYYDRLADIQTQIQKLQDGTQSDYVRQLKVLELQHKRLILVNNLRLDASLRDIENEFIKKCGLIYKEFVDRKTEFSKNLKKNIEHDILNMELYPDLADQKLTKKLRSRPNDPVVLDAQDKHCKPSLVPNISYLLKEHEIEEDVKAIQESLASITLTIPPTEIQTRETVISSCIGKPVLFSSSSSSTSNMSPKRIQNFESERSSAISNTKIVNGKLLFKKRWYRRGQTVFVEGRHISKFLAVISSIGNETIFLQKISGNSKFRINLSYLSKGKMSIKHRAAI